MTLSKTAEFWKHMLNTEAIIKIRVRSRGREYMKFLIDTANSKCIRLGG